MYWIWGLRCEEEGRVEQDTSLSLPGRYDVGLCTQDACTHPLLAATCLLHLFRPVLSRLRL